MEPVAKAPRTEGDGPTVTAYSMAGAVLWGPRKVQAGMTCAQLATFLDRPLASPGIKIACKESMLEMEKDLYTLPDPSDLLVHFDPPKPFDHSYVKELVQLAEELEGVEDDDSTEKKVRDLWEKHQSKLIREGVTFEAQENALLEELNQLIDQLKETSGKDYHPGTEEVVRDLVHPSLFPYVEGVSETTNLDDVTPQAGAMRRRDMWGRPYETSEYQWLPSEVSVQDDGSCKFDTYINNLDLEQCLDRLI